jgi:uncharacterized RDD family membrane protein YckC
MLLRNSDLMPAARQRAGVLRRALAALIDVMLAMILPSIIVAALQAPQAVAPLLVASGAAILWPLGNILCVWKWGRTPGKWLLGLRVTVWDPERPHERLQMGQILLREGLFKAAIPLSFVAYNLAWMASVMWLGYLLSIRLRVDRRALHDLPTHVQVVRAARRAAPSVAHAAATSSAAAQPPRPNAPGVPRRQRSSKSRKKRRRR